MSNSIHFNARLARLEARRRGGVPERERSAAVLKSLVARVDATHDIEDLWPSRPRSRRRGGASLVEARVAAMSAEARVA